MNQREHIIDSSANPVQQADLSSVQRYYYFDNLRAFALLLGIFFHSAIAYSLYMNEFWVSADPQKSSILEGVAFFTHLFRMPLFMLIAIFRLLFNEKTWHQGFYSQSQHSNSCALYAFLSDRHGDLYRDFYLWCKTC